MTLVPRGVHILVGVAPHNHALGSRVVHTRVVLNMLRAWHSMMYSRFPHHCHSGAGIVRYVHAGVHVHGSRLHHSSSTHGHPTLTHLLRRGSAMHRHLRVVYLLGHPHTLLGVGTHHGPSMDPGVHHLTLPHNQPMLLLGHHIGRVYHLLSMHDRSTHYLTGPGVAQVASHSRRLRLHRHLRVHSRRNGHPSRVRIVRERCGGSGRHSRVAHCRRNGRRHVGVRNGSCRGGADVWESWSGVSGGAHNSGIERGTSS